MTKLLKIFTAIMVAFTTSSCASTPTQESPEAGQPQVKRLVLYYSQNGTTEAVAEAIQNELGADIEAIEIESPYDGSYDETIERVKAERDTGLLPKVKSLKHNPADYDVIFLGYPIWFGAYAPPIAALISENDFNGLTVVPFCTFGSGGLDESSDSLRARLPKAEVATGFGIRAVRMDAMSEELHRFLLATGHLQGAYKRLDDFSAQRGVTPAETEIFNKATGDYIFPLGTAVTCGHRQGIAGEEYMFVAKNTAPDGTESYSTVFVINPSDPSASPYFTRVIR